MTKRKTYTMFELENQMFQIITQQLPEGVSLIRTPQNTYSKIDGFVVKENVAVSIFELKSKTYLSETQTAKEGWLIDYKKVETLAKISKELCIPTYLYGYMPISKKIFVWLICNSLGEIKNCSEPTMREISENSLTRVKKFKKVTYLQYSRAVKTIIAEPLSTEFLEKN